MLYFDVIAAEFWPILTATVVSTELDLVDTGHVHLWVRRHGVFRKCFFPYRADVRRVFSGQTFAGAYRLGGVESHIVGHIGLDRLPESYGYFVRDVCRECFHHRLLAQSGHRGCGSTVVSATQEHPAATDAGVGFSVGRMFCRHCFGGIDCQMAGSLR